MQHLMAITVVPAGSLVRDHDLALCLMDNLNCEMNGIGSFGEFQNSGQQLLSCNNVVHNWLVVSGYPLWQLGHFQFQVAPSRRDWFRQS